jgi:hypothetical protein
MQEQIDTQDVGSCTQGAQDREPAMALNRSALLKFDKEQ